MNQPAARLRGAADDTETTSEARDRGWFGPRRRSLSLSGAVRQHLVSIAYSQPGMLIAGGICAAGVAAVEWDRTGDSRWLIWLGAAVLLFTGRWFDTRSFRRAKPDPARWARRFTVGTWLNG